MTRIGTDRSPAFNPDRYGPALAPLLREERLSPPGPGTPNAAARLELEALNITLDFAPHQVADEDMAQSCISALWPYHDFLDESHRISQGISTPTGSYWHGIMHRPGAGLLELQVLVPPGGGASGFR